MIFEHPFFRSLIKHVHLTLPVLYSLLPIPFIIILVVSINFPISMSQIVKLVTFIQVTNWTHVDSLSTFFVIYILALIRIRIICFLAVLKTMAKAIFKITIEMASISPIVFSIFLWFPIHIVTNIHIFILAFFLHFSML